MLNARLLVMLLSVVAAGWSIVRWQKAVKLALVLLVFEGALRKWVLPGAQDLVYFAKDVLLLGAYIGFLQRRPALRFRPPAIPVLYVSLTVAVLIGLFQVVNPNLPNLLVGILGFKAYFFYVPLLFVVPATFATDAELYRFLRRYVLLAIPVGLLGVAQFFSPSSSVINTYAWGASDMGDIATFGTSAYVRVTGTFSFITGFTSYLLMNSILALALLGYGRWRLRGNLLIYASLGLTLLCILMSGSRGPVVSLAVLFPVYWWLAVAREGGSGATFGRLLVGAGLLSLFLFYAGNEALTAFYGRASGATDVQARITYPLLVPWNILPAAGLVGYGIGSTHQTAAAVTKGIPPYSWLHGLLVEPETGRIMVELGGVGFVLIYLIRLYMPLLSLSQVPRLRLHFHRALATACLLFFTAQILGTVIFDVTAGLYYWFFGGLLLTAIRLDQVAVARQAAAPPPNPVRSVWHPRSGFRSS